MIEETRDPEFCYKKFPSKQLRHTVQFYGRICLEAKKTSHCNVNTVLLTEQLSSIHNSGAAEVRNYFCRNSHEKWMTFKIW